MMAAALLNRVRRWLLELNLFESGIPEIEIGRQERWATRIYFVLLLNILFALALYKGLGNQTSQITIKRPSQALFESPQQKYPNTLYCPCSAIAINYATFIQIHPTYHQVCSSSFVTQEWISAAYGANSSYIWPMDARTVSSAYAQFLRSFCAWGHMCLDSIVNDSLTSFLINSQALSAVILKSKVNDAFQQTRHSGPLLMTTVLLAIRLSTMGNQIMSGLGTDTFFYRSADGRKIASVGINEYETSNSSTCYCYSTNTCLAPAAVYSNPVEPTFGVYQLDANSTPIKGMRVACYPLEGVLSSTLECHFDSSCIQLLVPNSTRFTPLNAAEPSRFPPNTTVGDLVNELMAEQWSFDVFPENYYTQCAPSTCTYSYGHRNTVLSVVTTIITVFGGLNTVLRVIVPWIAQVMLTVKRKLSLTAVGSSQTATTWAEPATIPVTSKFRRMLLWLWIKVKSLNLFESNSGDPLLERREQHTTRLYILLISVAFTVLFSYTAFTEKTATYNIKYPTQATYESLLATYGDEVQCPCTSLTVPYQTFTSIEASYHQICSSEFISDSFIAQMFTLRDANMYLGDFMQFSGPYFAGINTFCSLSQIVFSLALNNLYSNVFFNAKLLAPVTFTQLTKEAVQLFNDLAVGAFGQAIQELLELSTNNQLLSASSVSYNLRVISNESVRIDPAGFAGCSCLLNPLVCGEPAGFYSYNSSTDSFTLLSTVMGIRTTCFPLLSILGSNLACWYSSDCYENVIAFWRNNTHDLADLPPVLNASIPSQFGTSDLLLNIIVKMMIEEVSTNISYASFFAQCDPEECTYVVIERSDIIVIVTTLIGVFSGLNIVLKLLTPLAVQAIFWCMGYLQGGLNVLRRLRELPAQFITLNLFYNRYKSSELTVTKEKHATRLYLSLFTSVFMILLLYNIFAQQGITMNVQQPTEATYEHLAASFASSLQCPCSNLAISYNSFVQSRTAALHQVCYSPFVQSMWIRSVFGDGNWSNLAMNEFLSRGTAYFQLLQMLCNVAQQSMDGFTIFVLSRTIYSSQSLPRLQLSSSVNSVISDALRDAAFSFYIPFQCGRDSTTDNQLLTVYSSNWVLSSRYNANTSYSPIYTRAVSHGSNCSCATSSTCTEPVFVNGQMIPGFVLGCIPLESIFRSTLVCLYNRTCLDLINIDKLSSVQPLDVSSPSQYWPNTTVDELAKNMFVEQWSFNVSYSQFFNACKPAICTYFISQQKSILQIITTALGFYGGLRAIVYFAAPYIIALLDQITSILLRLTNRVIPFA